MNGLTIGEAARLAGLTVRTLHHFDAIGLVSPSARTEAGYRLYSRKDVERLQEVLFFRELGFPLAEIKSILEDPAHDRSHILLRQRRLLERKIERLGRMVEAVDAALEMEAGTLNLTNEEMLEVFGDFNPEEYREEAEQRWGDTDAYRQSAARAARYTKQDWQAISAESTELTRAFVALMQASTPPDSAEAVRLAERHRTHISKWFYDCNPQMHAGLGRLYVDDERFTRSIDAAAPGLAAYMAQAFDSNASRQPA